MISVHLLLFISSLTLVLILMLHVLMLMVVLFVIQRYPNGGCWILRIRKKAGRTNTSVLGKMWQVRALVLSYL